MFFLMTFVLVGAVPEVALLSAPGQGTTAELRFQPLDAELVAPLVQFDIAAGSTVSGALIPGTRTVVATLQRRPATDESWAFSLVRLNAQGATALLDGVAVAARPLVTPDGRVFVERGRAGPPVAPGQARIDVVSIVEVDWRTGDYVERWAGSGAFASPVGVLGDELVLYRADERGGHIEAVSLTMRATRRLLELSTPAHDFVLDVPRKRLLFALADPHSPQWKVESLDLATLARSTLAHGERAALLPTVFPSGRVAWAPQPGAGLKFVDDGAGALAPRGPGFERVRFFAPSGLAIGLHEVPSDFPLPLAVELKSGRAHRLAAPAGARLDVAGVLP